MAKVAGGRADVTRGNAPGLAHLAQPFNFFGIQDQSKRLASYHTAANPCPTAQHVFMASGIVPEFPLVAVTIL
jgi:hypothetical protein